ncbi:MAG TPA: hypothetical protein VFT06_03615, partial [Flavisolibacter sp.]|nr:hypothetical protein [Flavisolibacter sp.]
MNNLHLHNFHIPVLGLGFTIDTPLKVARFGISSVMSIVEDELVEKMREIHSANAGIKFIAIPKETEDYRAKRITAYLDLVDAIVKKQINDLKNLPFQKGNDLATYFDLLPDGSPVKQDYREVMDMADGAEKTHRQQVLRAGTQAGAADVNIMCKVNKQNYAKDGTLLPKQYNDALAALRGFANSTLNSSVVLSAGYNPELYAYAAELPCFFPDLNGKQLKKIILKVSDFRSARTQGKILAKKGIWVSEFRVESGLNCGGHAFATDGLLLGPIMEEFRVNIHTLEDELLAMVNDVLTKTERPTYTVSPGIRLSVQGGIGTANEHAFLLRHYGAESAGWGSPFLLVPDATNVEWETVKQLSTASKDDYFLSDASPLGVPFHNFRKSSSEQQRLERIAKGRPGSPCYKEHLVSDTTFTDKPICTASRKYQHLMIQQLEQQQMEKDERERALKAITDKDCLCEGLGASAILKNGAQPAHKLTAVAVCPGPNLAFFSGIFTLKQMIDHIYGRTNLLNTTKRPSLFINELDLYIEYLKKEIKNQQAVVIKTATSKKHLQTFQANLLNGIAYYRNLMPKLTIETSNYIDRLEKDLTERE